MKKEKWKYDFSQLSGISPNGQFVVRVDNEVKRPICVLPMPLGGFNTKEKQEANARLIAAAPDLLEALQDCKKAMSVVCSSAIQPFIKQAEKAINKATIG